MILLFFIFVLRSHGGCTGEEEETWDSRNMTHPAGSYGAGSDEGEGGCRS